MSLSFPLLFLNDVLILRDICICMQLYIVKKLELLMWKEHISFGVPDFGNYLRLIAAFLRGKEPYQFPDFLFVLQGTKGCDRILVLAKSFSPKIIIQSS